ncbi:MAG: hypothetical protein HRU17_14380 [Polyangiaceae bacterium]|nr:hypothetical protein [Polyangiaceae bacterium]
MKILVATHGHCFDGLASAALFTRMLQNIEGARAKFEYVGCGYGSGQSNATANALCGDQNAILDYRFSPSEKLTWYFDHHRTAFANDDDHSVFEKNSDNGRFFFDADCTSCTKLIAQTATEKFGMDLTPLNALIDWADRVDSANFRSPDEAIDRSDPLMRLVTVVEHYGDDAFLNRFVPDLLRKPLDEIANSGYVTKRYRPLGKKHEHFVERVKSRAQIRGRVVLVDLTDALLETIGKFVTYALYPDSMYSVVVARLKNGAKISVGFNPWAGHTLDCDISAICARYGGGGHPVVGGIAFPGDQLERAKQVATDICNELDGIIIAHRDSDSQEIAAPS